MILQNKHWIKLIGADHEARARRIAGKWLCFGPTPEMHLFQDLLNVLVEDGTFLSAKIARKDPATDLFPHKDCVICVYTSAERHEIDRAAHKLKEIGLTPSAWKSEEQTRTDWQGNGKLKLEAEIAQKKRALAIAESPAANCWQIFISKNSKDAEHARQVYDFLTRKKRKVFLSEISLREIGSTDYQASIDKALDECRHMVVVTSSKENLNSRWVEAEWRAFLNEKRSGRKSGNLLTMLVGAMPIEDLPVSLRSLQVERLSEKGLEAVVDFLAER